MNTFEEAQAAALKARLDIQKLEAMHNEASHVLAEKRQEFAAFETHAVDTLKRLESDIGEARRALQWALQRQNDAPLNAEPEGAQVATEDAGLDEAEEDREADFVPGYGVIDPDKSPFAERDAKSAADGGESWDPTVTHRVNPITGATERING